MRNKLAPRAWGRGPRLAPSSPLTLQKLEFINTVHTRSVQTHLTTEDARLTVIEAHLLAGSSKDPVTEALKHALRCQTIGDSGVRRGPTRFVQNGGAH